MDTIDWSTMKRERFEEIVEALLIAEYSVNGLVAFSPDGRGGDEGIDVAVYPKSTGVIFKIFQLKHFPGGMPSRERQRLTQVKDSLETAKIKHKPQTWVLVTITKLTVSERKRVAALSKSRIPRIEFMGPPELDALLGKHRAIRDRFFNDQTVEVLRAIHREEALVATPQHLSSELDRIHERADAWSPYWGNSFTKGADGSEIQELVAKRPDAAEKEPLSIRFRALFGPEDNVLQEQFANLLDYGGVEGVTLPGGLIESMQHVGPSWFQRDVSPAAIQISPIPNDVDHAPVRLETYDEAGAQLGGLSGRVVDAREGRRGWTIVHSLTDAVKVTWREMHDKQKGQMSFEFDPTGSRAHDVLRAILFMQTLDAATEIRFSIRGKPAASVPVEAGESGYDFTEQFVEFAGDFAHISKLLDEDLVYHTDVITTRDRVWARIACHLLSGRITALPFPKTLVGGVSLSNKDEVEHYLSSPEWVGMEKPGMTVGLLDNIIPVGDIHVIGRRIQVVNEQEVRDWLTRGNEDSIQIELRPINGELFWLRPPAEATEDGRVAFYPWALTGVPEESVFVPDEE